MDEKKEKSTSILLMHQTVSEHDAIGTDIECMCHVLKKIYSCYVFAEDRFHTGLDYVDEEMATRLLQERNNLVIYHHSVYWAKGEQLLQNSNAKLIFRYHNITPGQFFQAYNKRHYLKCKKGREQTTRYIQQYPRAFWLADSTYNILDLTAVQEENKAVCAPFHKVEKWTRQDPDEKILKELDKADEINLLFVGRVVPNKGHLFLLEVLRVFISNYHSNIKLRIVGKFDRNLEIYNHLIKQKIKEYHLDDRVEFIGEIDDAKLMSYYLGSNLFLCASEHEGFCVPILEAQFLGLPIIALNSSAIPDTGGKGQVILQKDARQFAAAIKLLMDDIEAYSYVKEAGSKNCREKFAYEQIEKEFMSKIRNILESL